ncbi:hypothetical protein ABMA28_008546 [Loxostege sticticalis]|uniref:Reverse transcriptase domain-containing protein n=1 Tax=Loxostege sticticalis TaxID=481309 RepID=A0ABD0SDT1_LOXSC
MPRSKPLPPRRNVYWWSEDIAELRRACIAARRESSRHRRRRRRDPEQDGPLYAAWRSAQKALQIAIAQAKARAREELLQTLNRDPWGRPYRTVRGKLRPWAPPVTDCLDPTLLSNIVSALFPSRAEHTPPPMRPHAVASTEPPEPVTEGELGAAVLRMKAKSVAPGPDGIPGKAWALAMDALGERTRRLFSACLEQGRFPLIWKAGRLVLLRKEGRPPDSPSGYRPIGSVLGPLLWNIGFDWVLRTRLCGGVGVICYADDTLVTARGTTYPEAARRATAGVATIVQRIRELGLEVALEKSEALCFHRARQAPPVGAHLVVGGVRIGVGGTMKYLGLTLDGRWRFEAHFKRLAPKLQALIHHGVPAYLQEIVANYLAARTVECATPSGLLRREVSRGVPQGSVLGPLLWNIGYDWVLRGHQIGGVSVTCYADDTLVTARGVDFGEAGRRATAGVANIVRRIRQLGLKVALEKSEALCFHGPRRAPPPGSHLVVGGTRIEVGDTLKYLGLNLDGRWSFGAHFHKLAPKLLKTAGALSRLMPNLGGPAASCRRLYLGVVRSMALYGAPVWYGALSGDNALVLRRAQRVLAVRVIRGYRTVSAEAALALAGSMPWDLDALVLAAMYKWRGDQRSQGQRPAPREVEAERLRIEEDAVARWRERLVDSTAGRRTTGAIAPTLSEWVRRQHGRLTFRATQVLSDHGCFGAYLAMIGREPTAECRHCHRCDRDTAQHTLASCSAWAGERSVLVSVVGGDLSLATIVARMASSKEAWQAVLTFCEAVISQKEAAEREREADASAPMIRRKRLGRRRRDYLRHLPLPDGSRTTDTGVSPGPATAQRVTPRAVRSRVGGIAPSPPQRPGGLPH